MKAVVLHRRESRLRSCTKGVQAVTENDYFATEFEQSLRIWESYLPLQESEISVKNYSERLSFSGKPRRVSYFS